jgi:hypothetical protein
VTRSINYLKKKGVDVASIALYEQAQAAMRIRNCLVHAAGMLSSARDEKELRRIQANRIYLAPDLRKKSIEEKVVIVRDTPLGDRLQITN